MEKKVTFLFLRTDVGAKEKSPLSKTTMIPANLNPTKIF